MVSCARRRDAQNADTSETKTLSISELGGNNLKNVLGSITLSSKPQKPYGNGDNSLAINEKQAFYIDIEHSNIPKKSNICLKI